MIKIFGGIALNDEDVLRDLNVFILSPNGCTDLHGANCFAAVKKEILSKLGEIKILKELKRIVLSQERIEGTILLKSFLAAKFNVFRDDVQHDAGDAYLSLLQCLPDSANICSLRVKRTRTCVNCLKKQELEVNEEWCVRLNGVHNNMISLQDAVKMVHPNHDTSI